MQCDSPTEYYVPGFVPNSPSKGAFRAMDFVKNRVGVEVQFGKYAFMVSNVCAKMTIFHKLGVIKVLLTHRRLSGGTANLPNFRRRFLHAAKIARTPCCSASSACGKRKSNSNRANSGVLCP
ncbi:BglII/BstYI family type II restriction endonuclease [Roseiflexus castenholzii]|uniref:BglII/BstYI family type II restriction endonuclease n=1 Tax=Roseiflexus castenholzii TaxID=120962 RepID=UPI003C7E10E9